MGVISNYFQLLFNYILDQLWTSVSFDYHTNLNYWSVFSLEGVMGPLAHFLKNIFALLKGTIMFCHITKFLNEIVA